MEASQWDSFLEAYSKVKDQRDLYRDLALLAVTLAQEQSKAADWVDEWPQEWNEELELIRKVWKKLNGTSISDSKSRDESLTGN